MRQRCWPLSEEGFDLQDTQLKYFTVSSLKDVCESIHGHSIIDFIREIH